MFVTLEVSKLSGWLNTDARQNMEPMSLTLDVSKLSGWLNALAPWDSGDDNARYGMWLQVRTQLSGGGVYHGERYSVSIAGGVNVWTGVD